MSRKNFIESLFHELELPPKLRLREQSLYSIPVKLDEMIEPQYLEHEKLYKLVLHWNVGVWCRDEHELKEAKEMAKKEWYKLVYGDLLDMIKELLFLVKHGSQTDLENMAKLIYETVSGIDHKSRINNE